ncbi:MAG: hypothetical protein ACPGGK_06495 [Pikeienuella sp.]
MNIGLAEMSGQIHQITAAPVADIKPPDPQVLRPEAQKALDKNCKAPK